MNDFSKSVDRRAFSSEKWNRASIAGICGNPDALPFWVADMDLRVSSDISAAMHREADLGVYGYRDSGALKGLFINFMRERHDTVLDEDRVSFAQGMLHAIALALNLFTKEGDRVLLPYPSYHPFIDMITKNNRIIAPYHLKRTASGFALDISAFAKASEGASCILFCSPHNPTGIVFSEDELRAVLTLARDRGQVVLCDEIHADLAHPGHRHIPLIKANEDVGARVVGFAAASKSFNIAGEHCAFALFSDSGMRECFERAQQRLYLTQPGYSVAVMAEQAYGKGLEYNRALCQALKDKLDRLEDFMTSRTPELRLCRPSASFIAFIDCSAIMDRVREDRKASPGFYGENYMLSHFFGWHGGICMNDGTWFGGDDYEAYVRFNFGCGDDLLEEGLKGLEKAVAAVR